MAARKIGLIALVVILVAAAAGGGWWWMNRAGGAPGSAEANESVDQPLTAELPASPYATPTPTQDAPPAAEQFTMAAVIEDPNGFTNVHSGPSTVAPIVARVSTGESFSTYEQGDDWWRVRTAGGLIGYMPRRRIRVQGAAPPVTTAMPGAATVPGQPMTANATPAADAPKAAAQRPRPPRPRSRINRANSANMRAFCQNAGRGTPQCRAFTRELRGR